MADRTAIEWTDASWNPLRARALATGKVGWFCVHVSEGCRNCYAEGFNARLGTQVPYKPQHLGRDVVVFLDEDMLTQPLRWKRPRKIFVGSMTDLFGDFVGDEVIDQVFAVMAATPRHTYQVLTKRPERMRAYLTGPGRGAMIDAHLRDLIAEHVDPLARRTDDLRATASEVDDGDGGYQVLPNLWLGTSAEDQDTLDSRTPELLASPAARRFLSLEPLIEAVEMRRWIPAGRRAIRAGTGESFVAPHWYMTRCEHCDWCGSSELCGTDSVGDDSDVYCPTCSLSIAGDDFPTLDMVIVGGESGPKARPLHPDWARLIRDACALASTAVTFFFKQWGEWTPGENVTRQTGVVRTATWFDDEWDFGEENLANTDGHIDDEPDLYRVGKKAAGNRLDGRTHLDFPAVR